MKQARSSNPVERAHSESTQGQDHWEHGSIERHKRSYDMLGDAFGNVFESVYLLQATMPPEDANGDLRAKGDEGARLATLKSRYVTIYKVDEATGQLEIEICPANESGVAQPYAYAPDEMRAALHEFHQDLIECTAGIPGVSVDARGLAVTVTNPLSFYEVIKSVCAARHIASSEALHDAYIAKADAHEEERAKPGHYRYMPQDKKRSAEFEDMSAGLRYQKLHANKDVEMPKSVFASLAMQPYGYQSIGRLINDFNKRAIYPLLSMESLEAVALQDRDGTPYLANKPAYNLH